MAAGGPAWSCVTSALGADANRLGGLPPDSFLNLLNFGLIGQEARRIEVQRKLDKFGR
jgi:hypothetical protein